MPPTVLSHVNFVLQEPALARGDVLLLDMAHVSEDAVDPQLPAAARTADPGNSILLLAAVSEHAQWPPKVVT